MTDRELLELAAKAAGITLELIGPPEEQYLVRKEGTDYSHWNPLDDDGDTFRLQVHVGMIVNAPTAPSAHAGGHAEARFYDIVITEPCTGWNDEARRAATRRAIVRCAAATVTPQEPAAS